MSQIFNVYLEGIDFLASFVLPRLSKSIHGLILHYLFNFKIERNKFYTIFYQKTHYIVFFFLSKSTFNSKNISLVKNLRFF